MNSMTPEMNAKDVCAIVKACGESGVTEITFGPLTIRFAPKPSVGEQQEAIPQAEHFIEVQNRIQTEQEAQDDLLHQELEIKRERLAMALIEDPVEFEKLLAAGELEE